MIRLRAHGRLFDTCAYLFRLLLGWALIRDVRLFETCAKSSIYGIRDATLSIFLALAGFGG